MSFVHSSEKGSPPNLLRITPEELRRIDTASHFANAEYCLDEAREAVAKGWLRVYDSVEGPTVDETVRTLLSHVRNAGYGPSYERTQQGLQRLGTSNKELRSLCDLTELKSDQLLRTVRFNFREPSVHVPTRPLLN